MPAIFPYIREILKIVSVTMPIVMVPRDSKMVTVILTIMTPYSSSVTYTRL